MASKSKFCCGKVCHGDELAYIYHDSGNPYPWNLTTSDLALSNATANYFASFAAYGDPNQYCKSGVPAWPLYRNQTDMNMRLDWPLSPLQYLNVHNCDMWDQVGYYHQNRIMYVLTERIRKRNQQHM